MNMLAKLTARETEIAELMAWGLCKKEIADHLFISERTVENHARNIYDKIGCNKVNELSAWWFCTKFKISFELSPLKRKIVSLCMLFILMPQIYGNCDEMIRPMRTTPRTTRTCRSRRRNESDNFTLIDFL